jgi:hypothetical protein
MKKILFDLVQAFAWWVLIAAVIVIALNIRGVL